MIPKIIHYCWFGKNPKSDLIKKCISSWKIHCPDYKIIEWNESNWDIYQYAYAEEAYAAKKWAFVSDVARLHILYMQGGIYLDTDVELLEDDPFEKYLQYDHVLCFENARGIASGLFFAAEKRSEVCKRFLAPYERSHYTPETMIVNTKMNEPIIREMLPELKWTGKTQIFGLFYIMGCDEYGTLMKHYGTRSWCEGLPQYRVSKSTPLKRFMRNPEIFEKLEKHSLGRRLLPVYTFLAYDLQDNGVLFFIKLNINKIKIRIKKKK